MIFSFGIISFDWLIDACLCRSELRSSVLGSVDRLGQDRDSQMEAETGEAGEVTLNEPHKRWELIKPNHNIFEN